MASFVSAKPVLNFARTMQQTAAGVCVSVCCGVRHAGHGYDNNQCAEFCVTSHHFLVNGKEHMLNFTEAGKPWGCADKVCMGSALCYHRQACNTFCPCIKHFGHLTGQSIACSVYGLLLLAPFTLNSVPILHAACLHLLQTQPCQSVGCNQHYCHVVTYRVPEVQTLNNAMTCCNLSAVLIQRTPALFVCVLVLEYGDSSVAGARGF